MRIKYKNEIVEISRVHVTKDNSLRFSILKDIASYTLFDYTMLIVYNISQEEKDHIMHKLLTEGHIDLTDISGVKIKYDYYPINDR